jgi:hypothetical protein
LFLFRIQYRRKLKLEDIDGNDKTATISWL